MESMKKKELKWDELFTVPKDSEIILYQEMGIVRRKPNFKRK